MSDKNYFLNLQKALRAANIATPTLVIDLARVRYNIKVMTDFLPKGMGYRIVAKSLPCLKLIEEVRAQTKTDRLMVFNLDYLELLTKHQPDTDRLLGKPLPAQAAEKFLTTHAPDRVQWLIDDLPRLQAYEALAQKHQVVLAINLELDVGLYRGGFDQAGKVKAALDFLRSSPHLKLAGFMGYEPHLASLPTKDGFRERAKQGAWNFYREVLSLALAAGFDVENLTRNAAGSPTYRLYEDTLIANEVSVGSVLLKPTDFDMDLLEAHQPASFIATPVLKRLQGLHLPGAIYSNKPPKIDLPPNTDRAFIYGGNWQAQLVYPPEARVNKVFGKSSNQELVEVPQDLSLAADDFVFFRPTQSEAVLTYFGALAIYEQGEITDFWEVFPARA